MGMKRADNFSGVFLLREQISQSALFGVSGCQHEPRCLQADNRHSWGNIFCFEACFKYTLQSSNMQPTKHYSYRAKAESGTGSLP